jgi:2-iminobutanoate/2-iminopropanoate deaminase
MMMEEMVAKKSGALAVPAAGRSEAESKEMIALGVLSENGGFSAPPPRNPAHQIVPRSAISAAAVLNEPSDYPRPSLFSRGLKIELGEYVLLLISGTASVDEQGETIHAGDFRAQCWRTYRNVTELLKVEGSSWQDVIRTTCYLRDIERDYKDFNEIRTEFFKWLGLNPLPASTGIQARLCREGLLVEIEAMALYKQTAGGG